MERERERCTAMAQKHSLPKNTDFTISSGSREPEVRDVHVDHSPLYSFGTQIECILKHYTLHLTGTVYTCTYMYMSLCTVGLLFNCHVTYIT